MDQFPAFKDLSRLIARVPGLGPRSARRIVLHLLQNKEDVMRPLSQALAQTADEVQECMKCGNFTTSEICDICSDPKRGQGKICVVETVSDLWAIERTRQFTGRYHIIGGLLSALNGVRPADLRLSSLRARMEEENIEEVILALSATVDGQTTAHYIQDSLKDLDVQVTRLAHGVPIGGELDYIDEGTLSLALKSRSKL